MSESAEACCRVAVILPIYNEEGAIAEFVAQIDQVANDLPCALDLIAVDDGSTDSTLKILEGLKFSNLNITIISLSRNFGKESAIQAGLDAFDHDAAIVMDADMQHPVEQIPDMISSWNSGSMVIRMRRADRTMEPWWRRQTSRWFYGLLNSIGEVSQIANASDFCLLDKVVVENIRGLPERNRMFKGLVGWCGFTVKVMDYTPNPRYAGQSSWNFFQLLKLAVTGITSFSSAPLQVWTIMGLVIAALAAIYGIQIVAQVLFYGRDAPGYASIMVSILFLGGVQLICLGVLGEYVARIYTEVKQRPQYIVKRRQSSR